MPRLGYRQYNARGLEYELGVDYASSIVSCVLPPVLPERLCTCCAKFHCPNCKAWALENRKNATAAESFYTSEELRNDGQCAALRRAYDEACAQRDALLRGTPEHKDAAAHAKLCYERLRRVSWHTDRRPITPSPKRSLTIIRDPAILRQDEDAVLRALDTLVTARDAMAIDDRKRAGMQESIILMRNRLRNIRRSKFYKAE